MPLRFIASYNSLHGFSISNAIRSLNVWQQIPEDCIKLFSPVIIKVRHKSHPSGVVHIMDNIKEIFLQCGFWQTDQITSERGGKRRTMPTSSYFATQTETPKFSITGQNLILDIIYSKSRILTLVQKSRIIYYL